MSLKFGPARLKEKGKVDSSSLLIILSKDTHRRSWRRVLQTVKSKIDYDQLLVNENAYFFKLKKPISKRDIEIIFEESIRDKSAERRFEPRYRESYVHGGKEIAKLSIDVFRFKQPPTFFTDDVDGEYETKYGLFVIVETPDLLSIVRRNVSGIKHLYSIVEKIDYDVLVRFLLSNGSKFEKIVTSNMNAASAAVQRKISEAEDLKGIFSRFGASKQIINALRIDNRGSKATVAVGTSRVNSFNIQKEFGPAIVWMTEVMKLMRLATTKLPQSQFIDAFATPIKFDDIIDSLKPIYLLLRFHELKDQIESGFIQKGFYNTSKKKIDLNSILSKERLFELKEDKDGVFRHADIEVKVREESITVSIESFKDIILDFGDGYEVSLSKWINDHGHFLIVFDKLEYAYTKGSIFKDSKLLGDTENFMSTFVPYKALESINAEKGKGYTKVSDHFKSNSLFAFVDEELAKGSKYLICDDMGVEWGDFISLDDTEVTFYHLKQNEHGLSAANLEVVFGQAQKNLGFLQLTEEMIEYRRERWQKMYKIEGVETAIKRIRRFPAKGNSIDALIKYANQVNSNANIKRRVFVVVDFISKAQLEDSIKSLKKGTAFNLKGVAMQLLWFVNGILALANEQGVEFRIICRP